MAGMEVDSDTETILGEDEGSLASSDMTELFDDEEGEETDDEETDDEVEIMEVSHANGGEPRSTLPTGAAQDGPISMGLSTHSSSGNVTVSRIFADFARIHRLYRTNATGGDSIRLSGPSNSQATAPISRENLTSLSATVGGASLSQPTRFVPFIHNSEIQPNLDSLGRTDHDLPGERLVRGATVVTSTRPLRVSQEAAASQPTGFVPFARNTNSQQNLGSMGRADRNDLPREGLVRQATVAASTESLRASQGTVEVLPPPVASQGTVEVLPPPPAAPDRTDPGQPVPPVVVSSPGADSTGQGPTADSVTSATALASDPGRGTTGEEEKRRDSLGDFQLPPKPAIEENDSDDESQTCIICYEPWSNSGKHRLASLKCGHIFGQSCITKWLKGKGGKCPQCNAKAKSSDVRVIYAKALKAIDTAERDKALKALEQEKELRRKIEIEKAQMALKYQMAMEEVNRIKSQVKHQSSSSCATQPGSSKFQGAAAAVLPGCYVLDKTISVSAEGNSRVLAYDYANHAIIASVPSPNQILFSGFGVKKISALMNWKASQYVPIHSKPIRGLGFNGRNDGLLLTGAMDKTLKITSLSSNTVVQTYNTCAPVWSCCWNEEDVNYLFAGLSNGTIVVYDTRNTSGEVLMLNREGSKHPIVAMNYVPDVQGSSSSHSGLLVGTLSNCSFWEQTSTLEFRPSILPLEGNCISLSFEPKSRHCLASFRPNKSCPSMRHVMCELQHIPREGQTETDFKCNPIQSFFGGSTVKLLARSAIFRRPNCNDHLLIAAGDEATSSLDLWDSSSGTKVQRLMTGATILDVKPFRLNNTDYLAALSEKVIKLYKWQV